MTEQELARFLSRVDRTENGCWMWTAGKNQKGYGQLRINGRTAKAHRAAYEHFVGPIPSHLVLDHYVCDDRSCVNPLHLRPVTNRENVLRGGGVSAMNLARRECAHGHEYTPENTYVDPRGRRNCRACGPRYKRQWRARRGASA